MSHPTNDVFGKVAGNELLKTFEATLDSSVNPVATPFRVGQALMASEAFEAPFNNMANENAEVRR